MDPTRSRHPVIVPPDAAGHADSGLTLVLGPPNSGKLGRVFAWWQDRFRWRPLIVVPNTVVATEVTGELLERLGGVVGQMPALTFDGLVREVLDEAPAYISEFQRLVIITSLVRGLPLTALAPQGPMPGLPVAVASLLQELAESGRSDQEVNRLLREWGIRQPHLAALAADLRQIRDAYARACFDLGVIERAEAVRSASLQSGQWSRPVAFYGFTSFTEGQRQLIGSLAVQAPVLVAFDHEHTCSVNLAPDAEIERWETAALAVERLPAQPRAYSSSEIFHLEQHLFRSDGELASVIADQPGVHFLLAAGERAEAELVAENVVALLRQGFSSRDIAVIVRDPQNRGRLLGQVFDSCGVPYELDGSPRLSETGLGHALLSALRGWTGSDPETLLAFLRSPYGGLSWEESTDMELHYRRGTADFEGLASLVHERAPRVAGLLSQLVNGDGLPLLDLNALRQLAYDMLLAASAGAVSPPEDQAGRRSENDISAFRAFQKAVDDWELAYPTALSLAVSELDLFLECMRSVKVGLTRGVSATGVSILAPGRARARRFAAVFIMGLVEGEFPARTDRPSVLTESQKRALETVAGPSILARHQDDEDALFLSSVSRPWQALFLSARATDDDGGEVLPSRFWIAAKRLLGRGECEHEQRGLGDVAYSFDRAPGARHYARAMAMAGLVKDVRAWERPPAALRRADVLDDLAALDRFSPSGLESYLACPFAWFLNKAVGIEDLAEQLDGRVVGSLLHAALSRVYRRALAEGLLPLSEDDLPRMLSLGHDVVNDVVAEGACPGTTAEKRLAVWRVGQLVETVLVMEAEWQNSLLTVETEVAVGAETGVDIGGLKVLGRVDRLDEDSASGGLFVVDYKSGKVPSAKKIGTSEGLQLPLYLLALAAERPERPLIGAAYVSPREQKRTGVLLNSDRWRPPCPADTASGGSDASSLLGASRTQDGPVRNAAPGGLLALSEDETDQLFATAKAVATRAAQAMRSGDIAPLSGRECPSWCDLRSACRAYRGRTDR